MTVRALPTRPTRDLRELLRLSRERMARLIGVSAKTVERWEASARLPARDEARARLAQLQEIADLAGTVYGRDSVPAFLAAPLAEHDGRTALQLIERGDAELVLASLASDFEGAGY